MPNQDAAQIREKILSILRFKGPLLPVHIANETGLSMLFSSAFLSELFSDKKVKMSYMKVGSSPIYFIPGQEPQLERYSNHLKSREKDAFIILKEKRIIKDSEQEPAIRVALRSIRDFAIPLRRNNETYWRYFTIPENEFKEEQKPIEEHEYVEAKPKIFNTKEREIGEKIIKDIKIEDIENIRREKEKLEEIAKEKQELIKKEKEKLEEIAKERQDIKEEQKKNIKKISLKKKPIQKKTLQKNNEKFFNQVKDFLSKESIEIVNVEGFGKDEIFLRIKTEGEEKLLVAYNKRKISENEIIKANKKASELDLKYIILSMGEPGKKLASLIESVKNLEKIERM
jgi:translation initiation factor 4G